MKRRTFLQVAAASAAALKAPAARSAEGIPKREYKEGIKLSVIGFGGIAAVGMEQKDADRTVAEAFDRGVNYFDVAPSYYDGEAELKLGAALSAYRNRSFLACKTTVRDAAGSRKELEQSLGRLKTDHFDLYQFHAVSSMDDVEKILAPGGAAETFLMARKEGKVRYLGASAHNAQAAISLMDRFPLDSILYPVNFVLYQEGNFGPQILEHAKKKGVARLALKTLARSPWPSPTHKAWPKCWYQPIDDPVLGEKSVRFTLSEDITAAIPPGEEKLFWMALDFAERFRPLSTAERQDLLLQARGIPPLFRG